MRVTSVHIQRNWWKYVLPIVAFMMLWTIVFDSLSAPQKNERIRISYLGSDLACERLQSDLQLALPSLTSQKIENLSVENPVEEVNNDFYSVLATRVYGADIIIIADNLLTDDLVKTHFLPLPVDLIEELYDHTLLHSVDGIPYGFVLPSSSGLGRFSKYYEGEKQCYAFITHSSVNAAGIYERGDINDDAALRVLQYLMGAE